MAEDYKLIDNEEKHRYEFQIDGKIAEIDYIKSNNGEIYLVHTEVPASLGGKVIMYADRMTDSMKLTIDETNRRREKQLAYNEANGITPQQIKKARNLSVFGNAKEADELLKERHAYVEPSTPNIAADPVVQYMSKAQMEKSIERTRKLMQEAAKKLEFIEAAQYRDELLKLEDLMKEKWG